MGGEGPYIPPSSSSSPPSFFFFFFFVFFFVRFDAIASRRRAGGE